MSLSVVLTLAANWVIHNSKPVSFILLGEKVKYVSCVKISLLCKSSLIIANLRAYPEKT